MVDHLFISCHFSQIIWDIIDSRRNVYGSPSDVNSLWSSLISKVVSSGALCRWGISVVTICWDIWRERNDRIFRDYSRSSDQLLALIISDIVSWIGHAPSDIVDKARLFF